LSSTQLVKPAIFIIYVLSCSSVVQAEQREALHWSFAAAVEYNGYSPSAYGAGGVSVVFSPLENRFSTLSFRAILNYNFTDMTGGDFAWRFLFALASWSHVRLLFGLEWGLGYAAANTNRKGLMMTLAGVGCIKLFFGKHGFVDLYIRGGYPTYYAVGIGLGLRYTYQ
jgi:hypothetical protein